MPDSTRKTEVFLIASPIGDILSDFSVSALEIIKRTRILLMEDIGVENPEVLYNRLRAKGVITTEHEVHLISDRKGAGFPLERIDEWVRAGRSFAILADKGLPCFLDPGIEIVQHLMAHHEQAVDLIPIGASSALDGGIALSGVDCTRFLFWGHFPGSPPLERHLLRTGIPVILYVQGDSLVDFVKHAKKMLGRGARHHRLTVLSNIRQRQSRWRRRFSMDEPLESFEALDRPKGAGDEDHPRHNFVVILQAG
jgi:16S rRNA C1402 (ribose-2'-O) methylase RsmI